MIWHVFYTFPGKMRFFLFAIVLATGFNTAAQDTKIKTDRPGETQNAELTNKGFFQVETGFTKEQHKEDETTVYHPEALLKYGLSDRVEIRSTVPFVTQKNPYQKNTGLQPIQFGFKLKILENKGAIPLTSLLTDFGIPTLASEAFKADKVFPVVRLLFINAISEKIKLAYNIGSEWDGFSSTPQWIYSFSPELEVGDKWEFFIELFGQIKKGEHPQHHFDGGLAYFISSNIKWDIYAGTGISPHAMDYIISSGISFQLK